MIDIVDNQADRRACRYPLEDAREDTHPVGLAALRCKAGLAGPASIQPDLKVFLGKRYARRHAVHHATDGRPVTLAPGRESEAFPESVSGHDVSSR
jgi:hypothetical protein